MAFNPKPNKRTVGEDQKFNTFLSLIDMYLANVKKWAFLSRKFGIYYLFQNPIYM